MDIHNLPAYVIPLLIFFARVLDVSLGTMRIIFVSRGKRHLAPVLGFFEVLVWVIVISKLVQGLDSWVGYVSYAAGFAAGSFTGMWIEDRLAIGTLMVQVVVPEAIGTLASNLREYGFGVTQLTGEGATGPVTILFSVIQRKNLPAVMEIVHRCHPNSFVTIEEIRASEKGVFPTPSQGWISGPFWRKAK